MILTWKSITFLRPRHRYTVTQRQNTGCLGKGRLARLDKPPPPPLVQAARHKPAQQQKVHWPSYNARASRECPCKWGPRPPSPSSTVAVQSRPSSSLHGCVQNVDASADKTASARVHLAWGKPRAESVSQSQTDRQNCQRRCHFPSAGPALTHSLSLSSISIRPLNPSTPGYSLTRSLSPPLAPSHPLTQHQATHPLLCLPGSAHFLL